MKIIQHIKKQKKFLRFNTKRKPYNEKKKNP